MSKFDSPRDERLHYLTLEGWGNQSDGNVECPVGWFCLITIDNTELPEIKDAFRDNPYLQGDDVWAELIGNFIVRENNQGFVTVESYDAVSDAKANYRWLLSKANEWFDAMDDESRDNDHPTYTIGNDPNHPSWEAKY